MEKLLKWKLDNRGRRKFLVKWEGYPLSEASWEPETNLNRYGVITAFCRIDGPPSL